MKPVARFIALFLWAILLIAIVGVAVSLAHMGWVPLLSWAIGVGAAIAALIRLHRGRTGSTHALKAARARREHRANRNRNDGPDHI